MLRLIFAMLLCIASNAAAAQTSQPPAAPASPAPHPPRLTLQQRFDAANATHDGHLTKDQAAAAKWPYATRNFDAIDKDHHGWITVEEMHNFAAARRAERKAAAASTHS